MTPFQTVVVEILEKAGGTLPACELRKRVMSAGWGKSPAAVAMHLTKVSFAGTPWSSYISTSEQRVFVLTNSVD